MKRLLGAAACCAVLLAAGCSEQGVTKDADYFEGLDPAVVAEVLDNPVASQKIAEEPEATQPSMAQGIVRNFIVCRDAFRVYQGWITTGQVPTLAPLPKPAQPIEPSNDAMVSSYAAVETAIASGEPQGLRSLLTAEGSCGQWIPADPGDSDGPTIKEAIEESS